MILKSERRREATAARKAALPRPGDEQRTKEGKEQRAVLSVGFKLARNRALKERAGARTRARRGGVTRRQRENSVRLIISDTVAAQSCSLAFVLA